MKRIRRALLEIWAVLVLAGVFGFLGPFGTYLMGDFLSRAGRWLGLLAGAYVIIRPTIIFLRWIANATGLPRGSLVFWGLIAATFPMTSIWRVGAQEEIRMLVGYSGMFPFALLCSLMNLVVVWWAERADDHLLRYYNVARPPRGFEFPAPTDVAANGERHVGQPPAPIPAPAAEAQPRGPSSRPRLYARLSPRFEGDVLALESEDHYVRVHGNRQSELLLLRLRDAIAEMDGTPGEQTHRSWWVARGAVAGVVGAGRNREIQLVNGARAPVARDSVDRLQRTGFLPH